MTKELLQYDISYDRGENDPIYLGTQISTHLKERFNVLLSKVEYSIADGHLVRQGANEPFLTSVIRGRDIVRELAPTPIDFDREDAEVEGFAKIDSFLGDPNTPLGSKVLSISPKGEEASKYQHNFYDIFTLKRKDSQRYIELLRCSSALDQEEYTKILGLDFGSPPTAAKFLANPIMINNIFVTAEQIHKDLHKEHEYMTEDDFQEIWTGSQPAVLRYLLNKDANSFNAVLNLADEVWENQKKKKRGKAFIDYKNCVFTPAMLRQLGSEPVRQVAGGCPGKSGADTNNSAFSVSEFGNLLQDKYGDRTFPCPNCGKMNTRPKDKLLSNCQHCGSDKVACKDDSSKKTA